MSATTTTAGSIPSKHEWLVILPDHPDSLSTRQQVRPEHLAGIKPLADAGTILFGGAFFENPPPVGEAPHVKGTVLLAYAESKDEVLELLKQDAYTKNGVWDWQKVQIYAFKTALRRALEGGV